MSLVAALNRRSTTLIANWEQMAVKQMTLPQQEFGRGQQHRPNPT